VRVSDAYVSIGEVVERIGLSLRTIRYYEEVGLAVPSARTKGGHRLYTDADIDRLRLIMKMKPLGFSLEEMGAVLAVLDDLHNPTKGPDARERLSMYRLLVEERLRWLQERLVIAHDFKRYIEAELTAEPGTRPPVTPTVTTGTSSGQMPRSTGPAGHPD
jgi:DNA-binding transcriptional MerR regulator